MNISSEVIIAIIGAVVTLGGSYIGWQVKKVHTLVNSRATEQDAIIELLRSTNIVLKAANEELRSAVLALQQNATRIASAAVPALAAPPAASAPTAVEIVNSDPVHVTVKK